MGRLLNPFRCALPALLACVSTLLVWSLSASVSAKETTRYVFTDLGATLQSDNSGATAINNHGVVVVHTLDERWTNRAYVWTPAPKNGTSGRFLELGALRDCYSDEHGTTTYAHGINDKGEIVGVSGSALDYKNWSAVRPFKIAAGRKLSDGSILHPSDGMRAHAINDRGVIVGVEQQAASSHAVKWSPDGKHASLGKLHPDDPYCEATDINNRGTIVGNGEGHAWVLTGMHKKDLGKWRPSAVNNHNVIVGERDCRACIWAGSEVRFLDRRPARKGFYLESCAVGIDDLGQVVGYQTCCPEQAETDTGVRAVLWENGTTVDLNNVVKLPQGWVLKYARDINNKGQIVGEGTYTSKGSKPVDRAFLLTPVKKTGR